MCTCWFSFDMWHCHEKHHHVVICQWRIRCCWFPLCMGQVLQSRPALGLCMTCLSAIETLSLIVVFHFLRRFVPCVLAMLALVHALRLHTDLHLYCCVLVISRFSFRTCIQLAIPVLSQMSQASIRPSSILSTFTSVMVSRSQSQLSVSPTLSVCRL